MEQPAASTGWQPLGTSARRRVTERSRTQESFLRLALAHAAVTGGDAMVTVALAGTIFFSTDPNGARGRVLLTLLITMAPFAVVAPFLGPAIDRSKGGRRLMVIAAAAGRAAACLFMAREVHSLLLFPGALALLVLSKAHSVAKSSLVPATVDSPADLVKAGGRLAVVGAIAGFAAGGPAAVILKVFDAAWVLRLAAVVYAAGAVMAVRIRPAPPSELEPADHVDEAVRSRGVSMAAVAMGTIRGISGFLTFAVAFSFRRGWGYVGHDHHHHTHHAPTWWYGVVLVGGIVGGFIGNLLGPRVRTMLREERMLTLALAIVGFAGFFVAFIGGRLTIVLVAFAAGLADGFGQLAFDAIVQRDGAEGSRARSFARYEATFQLTWVAAALLPVAVPISSWLAELVIGLVGAGAAANYLFGRVISIRRGAPAVEPGLAPAQRDEHPVPWSEPEAAPVRPPSLPSPSGPRRNPRRAR